MDCCHDRGTEHGQPVKIDILASGDTGQNTYVTCNTPTARMNVPIYQIDSENNKGHSHRPASGICVQDYSHEIHCHTPASPCCRPNVNTPGECKHAEVVQDFNSLGTPVPGFNAPDGNYHRRKSTFESVKPPFSKCESQQSQAPRSAHSYASNVKAEQDISVHTPHSTSGSRSNEAAAVHTPRDCVVSADPGQIHPQSQQEMHTEDYFSKPPDDPTSREFMRCAEQQTSRAQERSVEQQTSRGNEKSVEQQTSRGLESYDQGLNQDNCSPQQHRDREPSQPTSSISQSNPLPNVTVPAVLNHLSYKEKQLVLSAIRKASSNMSCATLLKERDARNSGSVTRRDFQIVMDKIGVLKDLSSRELEAVYNGFPAKSDTEFDYNKFVSACRDYKSKASKNMI